MQAFRFSPSAAMSRSRAAKQGLFWMQDDVLRISVWGDDFDKESFDICTTMYIHTTDICITLVPGNLMQKSV